MRVGIAGIYHEAGERALEPALSLTQQRVAADEVALVEIDEAIHSGLERRVVRRHVVAPETVGLLEPHGVERSVAEVDNPVLPAGFHQEIV